MSTKFIKYIFKPGHDIQPDNMWGLGQFTAMLNHMTTGLVYTKKIPVKYIDTGEYEVDVEVEHACDWRDYPEVCEQCFENHIDGLQQFEEDNYRHG